MSNKRKKSTKTRKESAPRSAASRSSKQLRSGKITGRPRDIKVADLPSRYRKMKSFLEHHWGLFSLDLKRVQNPDDVRAIFKRVKGVEWMPPFREHAACLICDTALAASGKKIRATRKEREDAAKRENRFWFDYNNTHPIAREAMDALKQAISNFKDVLGLFPFFSVISILAKELRVEELNRLSAKLDKAARDTQQEKLKLEENLRAYEADFARHELVRFVNENDRAHKTLVNFARVIAGLPEWSWIHSIRECKKLGLGPSTPEYPYQIFQRLQTIVRGMKSPKLENIERRLRGELLSPDCDPMLRGYADLYWAQLLDAIYSCRAVDRKELPDRIMEQFQHNLQTPRDSIHDQIAKRNRLVVPPKA